MNAQALPRRHPITVEEYGQMAAAGIFGENAHIELIGGEIIDMAPIGTRHAECVSRLARLLIRGTDATVRVQDPICLEQTSEPQPDLVVARSKSYADVHPEPADILLLIEVADTSLAYDRETKLPLYARRGIPEVWLVDLIGGRVEVYRNPMESAYASVQQYAGGDSIQAALLPEIALDVADILPAG